MTHHTCWLRYHQFLIQYHRYILLFWILVTIVSAIFGPRFFSATSVQDDDLPGTPSYDANKVYRQYYPSQASQSSMVVLLSISDTAHTHDPNMTLTNTPFAYAFQQTFIEEMNTSWSHEIISIMGYYTYINTNMSAFASSFITDDERAMIISIDYNYDAPDANPFVHDVRNRVESIREHAMSRMNTTGLSSLAVDVNSYDVGATGTELMIDDCADESEKDFINMDVIVLPIALLVLALYLSNLRLMIIPILSVGITLLTSCLIMYLVAIYMFKVASFTPSIMVSIIIAMSIDYSLFMLTRFKEEISHGRNLHDAVENMICQAGHVVLASGTTLTITFAGLIFLPLNFLQSCGIGAAAALICCMSVNLSITPCLLLTFGKFFSKFNIIPTCCYHHQPFTLCMRWVDRCRRRPSPTLGALEQSSHHIPLINTEDDSSHLDDGAASLETFKQQQRIEMHRSRWYRIAHVLTTTRYSIIFFIITLICMIPICYYATEIRVSSDTNLLFPRDSSSAHVYQRMKTMFSPGTIDPYRIIMSTPDHTSVLSPDYYTACTDLIHTLLSQHLITNTSIRSITYVGGNEITYEQAMLIMYGGDKIPKEYQEEAMIYRALFHQLVSTNQSASIIQLETDFDPSGDMASNWISSVRDILTHPTPTMSAFSYHLVGGATSSVDALHEITRLFPILMISTTAIVFIIVALLFRSLLVPVRLLFTITLGLSFVYGFAVLVFQHGILNAIFPVLRDVHAVYYYIPVMTFSILVGLSIDYDLFLAVRIAEYRRLGYTNRASIIKAIYKTGSIITAAGLIMTVAFGGLGIAQTMVLNQYGLVLCVAVLVDTFVVRTLLVPALFHLFGERGWWPGKMPPPQHDVDAFIELHDVHDPDPDLDHDLALLDATAPELSPDSYRRESDYHAVL